MKFRFGAFEFNQSTKFRCIFWDFEKLSKWTHVWTLPGGGGGRKYLNGFGVSRPPLPHPPTRPPPPPPPRGGGGRTYIHRVGVSRFAGLRLFVHVVSGYKR